ncbi:MAG: hypothetical protein ACRCZG_05820 [Culicoidibacterales bacterium]
MMKYDQLFFLLQTGKERELTQLFPTLAQWHTPLFDTLTWAEVYPLLTQWLRQQVKILICTNSQMIGKIHISEWLFTLQNGEELLVCCVIDPTTTHGMDVRMYHSFVPLFGKNQSREQLPLQNEQRIKCQLPSKIATQAYYLPATGPAHVSQEKIHVQAALAYLNNPQQILIYACWQMETVQVIEYETQFHQVGVAVIELNQDKQLAALRQYNDWEA